METESTKFPFEEALRELEKLVADLEKGELPLEQQLKAFEKGVSVSRDCLKRLEEIEHRVEKLIQLPGGGLESEPFSPRENQ